MTQVLQKKHTVRAVSTGLSCKIQKLLGAGGQGEVYQAQLQNDTVALKWYYPQTATPEQHKALETLVAKGPPDGSFLWPLDMVT